MAFSLCLAYVIVISIASFVLLSSARGSARNTPNCQVIVTRIDKHQIYASVDTVESMGCCSGCGDNICSTFNDALDRVTSGTIITINVTKELELFSIKSLNNLQFVTIIGHNNPTVACRNGGGLNFSSCHNCTVEGITWVGCGSSRAHDQPAILFHNSSNVMIKNCSFMQSNGPAVVLSEVSGSADINHCKFMNNTHDSSHVAASLHYSSGTAEISELVLVMNYCKFSNGKVIPTSHSRSCIDKVIIRFSKTANMISPKKIVLYNSAIQTHNNTSDVEECNTFYVTLG